MLSANTVDGGALLVLTPPAVEARSSAQFRLDYATGNVTPLSSTRPVRLMPSNSNDAIVRFRLEELRPSLPVLSDQPKVYDLWCDEVQTRAGRRVLVTRGVIAVLAQSRDERRIVYLNADGVFFREMVPVSPERRARLLAGG